MRDKGVSASPNLGLRASFFTLLCAVGVAEGHIAGESNWKQNHPRVKTVRHKEGLAQKDLTKKRPGFHKKKSFEDRASEVACMF